MEIQLTMYFMDGIRRNAAWKHLAYGSVQCRFYPQKNTFLRIELYVVSLHGRNNQHDKNPNFSTAKRMHLIISENNKHTNWYKNVKNADFFPPIDFIK